MSFRRGIDKTDSLAYTEFDGLAGEVSGFLAMIPTSSRRMGQCHQAPRDYKWHQIGILHCGRSRRR